MIWLLLKFVSSTWNSGCNSDWIGDGVCDALCMTELNYFDELDCSLMCKSPCTVELRLNADCDLDCFNSECKFDYPYCFNSTCATGCNISQLGNDVYNVECDNSDCFYDLGDARTVKSETFYVNGELNNINGIGSQNDPFSNIQEALKQLKYNKTEIYLLNNIHYLTKDSENSLSSIRKKSYTEVIIQPKYCEEGESNCVEPGDKPIVYLLNDLVSFDVYAKLIIKNVRFEQDYFFVNCSECEYCRYYEYIDGVAYSDQGLVLNENEYGVWDECEAFKEYSIFNVYSDGELELEDVEFYNMRMMYSSIIYIKAGLVKLTNVDFHNIVVHEDNAVIFSDKDSEISSFIYQGGTISFINNGFELNYQTLSSFITLYSTVNVILTDLTFKYNIISKSGSSLINLNYFSYVSIKNCEFEFNFVNKANIVHLKNDKDWMDSEKNDEINVEISNCTVKNNTADTVFELEYDDCCQKIWVHDNSYESNLVKSILSIENKKDPTLACIYGDDSFTAAFLLIESEDYENNKVESLIELTSLSNIEFNTLSITESLMKITSEYTTFNSLKAQPGVYLTSSISSEIIKSSQIYMKSCTIISIESISANCIYTSLLNTKLLSHLVINNVSISNSEVNNDLISIEITDDFALSDIVINNTYITEQNSLIYIETFYSNVAGYISNVDLNLFTGNFYFASVHNIKLINIKAVNSGNMEQALIYVWFSSSGEFLLENSEFEENLCPVLKIEGGSKSEVLLNLDNLSFKDIKSSSSLIQIVSPISIQSESYFKNLVFEFNSNTALDFSSLGGYLEIESSIFRNNTSQGSIVSVAGKTVVQVSECEFIGNEGAYVLHIEQSSSDAYLRTFNCIFEENTGISVNVMDSIYKDEGSLYTLNSASYGPAIHSTSSTIYIANSIITNNLANIHGTIYVSWKTYLSGTNITFTSNMALNKGGAIFIEQDSTASLSYCTFLLNTARIGSALFMQHTISSNSLIANSTFISNAATLTSCIYLLESNITLESCQISNNSGLLFPSLTAIFTSLVSIKNSHFFGHNGLGGHLSIQYQSECTVSNTIFGEIITDTGASAVSIDASYFKCFGCIFEDYYVNSGSCIICRESTCIFHEVKFTNLISFDNGKVLNVYGTGSCYLENCEFTNFVGTGVYCGEDSFAVVKNTEFNGKDYLGGTSSIGTGIFCYNCIGLEIDECNFISLTSESLGGSIMINSNTDSNDFIISSSNFTFSKSAYGGAVYVLDSSLAILGCNFNENQATNSLSFGEGGSVFILQTKSIYDINITDSVFTQCSADNSGGGIQWYGNQPVLLNNTYYLNKAVYGANFASFPYKLDLDVSRKLETFLVAPGQTYESDIIVYVYDHYDQIVTNNNNTLISLSAINPQNSSLAGLLTAFTLLGAANLSNFIVYGPPGSIDSFTIKVSSTLSTGSVNSLDLFFEIRDCAIGEEEQLNSVCLYCKANTYNLKAGTACLPCPNGAVCYGGSQIVANSGYWRTDNLSTTFYECPNQNACLIEKVDSDDEHCASGYKGICCHSCEYGYSRTGSNQCSACIDEDKNTGLLVGLIVLAVVLVCGITSSNINGAYKEQSITSIYFKILMNYIQLVALTISFNLSWPWFVKKMFEIQGKASGGSDQLISIDCFLDKNIHPYFAKLIILSLTPIVSSLLSMLFWIFWSIVKKSKNIKQKLIGSMIVQLFFFQPTLVKYNFTMFNCTGLEIGYYMTEDLSIKCWESLHLKYTLSVVLPSIFIWCIGIPACLLVFLFKNRKDLNNISEKLKYGFLYKGFKNEVYYWEFIILLKKILIISCSVFLKNVSVAIQALAVFIVISSGFILQERMQPYCYQQLNKMEIRSIVVSGVTIYSGMFFLTGDLSDEGKILLFLVMVATNMVFLMYWIYYTFGYYIGKAYLRLRCCKKLFHGKLDNWAAKVVPDGIIQNTILESEAVINDLSDKSAKRIEIISNN